MPKSGNIVRYTAEEIDEMLLRGEDRTDVEWVKSLTEEELEASIDFEEEGTFDWENVVVGLHMPKEQLTVRFDGEIIAWFKAQGPGYQTRMNAVPRSYVDAEKRKAITEARTSR